MTKFRKVLLGCIGLCIVTALGPACAQNAPTSSAQPTQWHSGQRIFSQLNLTDDQRKQNTQRPL